jgi:hypothetical protein
VSVMGWRILGNVPITRGLSQSVHGQKENRRGNPKITTKATEE